LKKHINQKTKTLSIPYKSTWQYYSGIKALIPPNMGGLLMKGYNKRRKEKGGEEPEIEMGERQET
jgi:hypothetical protein